MYQTLAIHDMVQVTASATRGGAGKIMLTCNDERVPCDSRNTCYQIVERALDQMKVAAQVEIHIEKQLPVRGGLGAGSANAAAALIGLEREMRQRLPAEERLAIAAQTGSDVPLFLIGGTVLGLGRGEEVYPLPDLPQTPCVLATPDIGVSTPQAFQEWDRLHAPRNLGAQTTENAVSAELTGAGGSDRLKRLGRRWTAALAVPPEVANATGVFPEATEKDRAGNLLLELVRTGIENDFQSVVFSQYPSLRDILEILKQDSSGADKAVYAALSGSGSALFGLFQRPEDASAAAKRLADDKIPALETTTMNREEYWRGMVTVVS
jgi:4-diphosphocytidyl-2-C-methyl-D-erythritol kinase